MTVKRKAIHDTKKKLELMRLAVNTKYETLRIKNKIDNLQWEMTKIVENYVNWASELLNDLWQEREYYLNFLNFLLDENWTYKTFNEIEEIAINLVREKKIILNEKERDIEEYVDKHLENDEENTEEDDYTSESVFEFDEWVFD